MALGTFDELNKVGFDLAKNVDDENNAADQNDKILPEKEETTKSPSVEVSIKIMIYCNS